MTTPTVSIDGPQALNLLERAVDTRGADFVYVPPAMAGACLYFHPSTQNPGCGVGEALSLAGVSSSILRELDAMKDDTAIDTEAVRETLENHNVHLTQDAVRVFSAFQERQDQAWAWGDALQAAEKVAQ